MLLLISLMLFRGHKQNRGWYISLHGSDCCSPFSNPWSMSPGSGRDQWLCRYQFVFTPCLGNWFCSWGFLMCSIYSRGDSGVWIQPQSSLQLCLQASFLKSMPPLWCLTILRKRMTFTKACARSRSRIAQQGKLLVADLAILEAHEMGIDWFAFLAACGCTKNKRRVDGDMLEESGQTWTKSWLGLDTKSLHKLQK